MTPMQKPAILCENYPEFVANFCMNNPQNFCQHSTNIYIVTDRIAKTHS